MTNYIRSIAAACLSWAALWISGICFAQVTVDQIAVGGVSSGCTIDYVEGVYGQPTASEHVTSDTGVNYIEYNYENHLLVGFRESDATTVYVTCTSDNLSTPDGVAVGMTADVLNNTYGQADHLYNYNDKSLYEYDDVNGNCLSFDVQNFYIVSVNVRAAQ